MNRPPFAGEDEVPVRTEYRAGSSLFSSDILDRIDRDFAGLTESISSAPAGCPLETLDNKSTFSEESKREIQSHDGLPVKRRKKKKPSQSAAASSSSSNDAPVEVDFFQNPTILSRLVLYQKYEQAMDRLRRYPEESSVWVCAKRQQRRSEASPTRAGLQPSPQSPTRGRRTIAVSHYHTLARAISPTRRAKPQPQQQHSQYSIRQLPLHIACSNLARALDTRMRALLNDLIANLVIAYPDGCQHVDHTGSLALHQALSNGASPETLSMFLMAHPESRDVLDNQGRSLSEINRYGRGDRKKQVQEILDLDVEFWKETKREATFRLKQEDVPWPSDEGGPEVDSTAVLASSVAGAETIETMPGEEPVDKSEQQRTIESDEIVPMAWEQLEERAIALEQVLAEMNESNYVLNKKIETLARSKLKLIDKLDSLHKSKLMRQFRGLQKENKRCKRKIEEMKQALRDTDESNDGEAPKRQREGSSSDLLKENVVLEKDNRKLRKQYSELNINYHEQRAKLRRLEQVIASLMVQENKKPSSKSHASSVSGLTTNSSDHDVGARGKKAGKSKVEIEWSPPLELTATIISDRLSVILQAAAENERITSSSGQEETKEEVDPIAPSSTSDRQEAGEHDLNIPALLPLDASNYDSIGHFGLVRSGLAFEEVSL